MTQLATEMTQPPEPLPIEKDPKYGYFFDYMQARGSLDNLRSSFSTITNRALTSRAHREWDFDVDAAKMNGDVKKDDFVIPIRCIDTNIKREIPTQVAFLKQSRRLAIFTQIGGSADTQELEREFTRGLQYAGWEVPFVKVLDGSKLHGWDLLEIVYLENDPVRPFNLNIEHVGHDNFYFPVDSEDLQTAERVVRRYMIFYPQLETFVKEFGFDATEIKTLQDSFTDNNHNISIEVFKTMFKVSGVVYVAWFSPKCQNWLKAPLPLYMGRKRVEESQQFNPMTGMIEPSQVEVDVQETDYPYFLLPYTETEERKICKHMGRAFYDKPSQVALSSIWSSYVRGCHRATSVYGSVKTPTSSGVTMVSDLKLEPDRIYTNPVDFFAPPVPDSTILNAAQQFDTKQQQDAGHINFATLNRKDSEKTATEIVAANNEQALLSSVDVVLFSVFTRTIFTYIWSIVQNLAARQQIEFLRNPVDGLNDVAIISLRYEVKAAGDVDVIQRAEKIQQMRTDWAVISTTGVAQIFLEDYLRLSYPEQADRYVSQLQEDIRKKEAINSLLQVLQTAITPEEMQAMPPQAQQQLQGIVQNAQQLIMPAQQ